MGARERAAEEAALRAAVGAPAFLRARAHLDNAELRDVQWDATARRARGRVSGAGVGTATATVVVGANGGIASVDGRCTCRARPSCDHPVALLLATLRLVSIVPAPRAAADAAPVRAAPVPAPARTATATGPAKEGPAPAVKAARTAPAPRKPAAAAWESALSTLARRVGTPASASAPADAVVGLQFELVEHESRRRSGRWRIGIRPVLRGRSGGWIRSGISWSNLAYAHLGPSGTADHHRRLLTELAMLSTVSSDRYRYGYGVYPGQMFLDDFGSRRLWNILAEAEDSGLPLVQAGKWAAPVRVSRRPARLSLRIARADDDLVLDPVLMADDVAVEPEHLVPIGSPPHGIAWWGVRDEPEPAAAARILRLTALDKPLPGGLTKAVTAPAVRIPAADEQRFVKEFLPVLVRQADVVAAPDSVPLPRIGPVVLTLAIARLSAHRLSLHWSWTVTVGSVRHSEPLHPPAVAGSPAARSIDRSPDRDDRLRQVTAVLRSFPDLLEDGQRLPESSTVGGDDMLRFLTDAVPRLAECDGVEIELPDDGLPPYRETADTPVVAFADAGGADHRDWFDLTVQVSVGGEEVAFDELFVALAEDRRFLILPSGTYFSLDRKEFRQLRELIEESRALEDVPAGVVRAGRWQAGLWDDLADLGPVTGQAAEWQRSVRTLCATGAVVDHPVPPELTATLRPYQREGFHWLAALYDHRLGGILADDMGLGKTLQALALACHVRGGAPLLVVAPASVVDGWVTEAERFAPGLAVRAVTRTGVRRGADLVDLAAGADILVTSYTLFRLEYDEYAALDWAGLVLDEAQFVKNHQSRTYRCARQLPAPFKLAITGTPLENNLAELWALTSIVAPGLFPRLDRFTTYYRTPIERDRDADRLALLRRRVRPLMLRRRKADVATDLPPKQEQIIDLELDRRHRRVYQTYLQRERQKVLGLLGEFEKNRFEIFRSLTLLRQASLDVSLVDPRHEGVPSTKLDALVERVTDLVAEGHRTLVFSQFTRFLGTAGDRLREAGVGYEYLDGSTRNRRATIAAFKSGTAPVFLIGLKAGGFGLNLTEADYCILLDPWWNPAAEAQAVDRVHRIGQTRSVMVYRMVARDTIEEKVVALQARKAELFSSVLDGGGFASAGLTAADIRALLE